MLKIQFNSSLTRFVLIGEMILVLYLLYTLTVSIYKSYQLDKVITEYDTENTRIADENRRKTEDFEYFSSDNYVEKIAKQNLGLVRPGEEVIVIQKSDIITDEISAGTDEDLRLMSNSEIWMHFFFDSKY